MSTAMDSALECRTERRRAQVRAERRRGVDGVEAGDDGRMLTVTFIGKAPRHLGPANIRVDGGRRVTGIRVLDVELETADDPDLDDLLHVTLDRAGDTSTYTLCVVEADPHGRPGTRPYPGFDPRYACAEFTFHPQCPTDLDCLPAAPCPPAPLPAPVIDYTARDYGALRRLLLDRMTLTAPRWVERHVPDLQVALAEVLAYVGDQLSYLQDAVATEAYLDTARRRVSVRRHVRLVDYAMHDGCNARTFVTLQAAERLTLEAGRYRFAALDVSRLDPRDRPDLGTVLADDELARLPAGATCEVFEPLGHRGVTLHPEHNEIRFWAWGDEECCLPVGATAATLRDTWTDEGGPGGEGPAEPGDHEPGDHHGDHHGGGHGEHDHDGHGDHERGGHGHGDHGQGDDHGGGPDHDDGGHDGPGDHERHGDHERGGHEHGDHGPGDDHDGRPDHDDGGHGDHGDHPSRGRRALRLVPGDILIIEEVVGPATGAAADADPTHRQAVRLTSVTSGVDTLFQQPIVEVSWAAEDALRFPVCLSARGGPDCELITDVSVARGNVVVADHGRSLTFCDHPPELIDVPPAAVEPLPCGPPDFGCPGEVEQGPAVTAIHELLAVARAGLPLSTEDISRLVPLVGQAALVRAGLAPDAPAAAQAAALEALLAQVSYPPARSGFRPVLREQPVTQHTPYPAPELVATAQSRLLDGLPAQARARVERLWRAARDGHRLTPGETAELTVLFGPAALAEVRLTGHAARQARALGELLARFDELLAGKLARLGTLAARAQAGTVLGADVVWEIRHTWGEAYASGLDPDDPALAGPAAVALAQDPRAALPAVRLAGYRPDGEPAGDWLPRRDLLGSGPRDRDVVGEVGDDGRLTLRFGDGAHGAPPPPGGRLRAYYRLGNGAAGNVGADAIDRLVLCAASSGGGQGGPGGSGSERAGGPGGSGSGSGSGERPGASGSSAGGPGGSGSGGGERGDGSGAGCAGVTRVRNPLPATGGTDPEPVDAVRQLAPLALHRVRLRAVTAADYAELAGGLPGVQRAAAQLRWTGSGVEAEVAIDPVGTALAGDALIVAVTRALEPYRRIGHDLVVGPARLVPLDVQLSACLDPGYDRGHVRAALLAVLGSGRRPDGGLGFFHPDALTFGEPVRVSRLVAAAAAVPGVLSAQVTRLRRLFGPDGAALADGLLRLGPLEIAQCDNTAAAPENGRLSIVLGGGR